MTELTKPYTLSRTEVALATAEEYVRSFWPVLAGFPIFGLIVLALAPAGPMRGIAYLCIVWPLLIPLRAFSASAGAAKHFGQPVVLLIDDSALYLRRENGVGSKIPFRRIRRLRKARGLYRAVVGVVGVLFVPEAAFLTDHSLASFEESRKARG